jgi:AmmeMemoRadiSam system protein B/AmmeMemoRadiSam system protein A
MTATPASMMGSRPAAVAGMFYPVDAGELGRTVDLALAGASGRGSARDVPKAVIVPHAGYVYSGPVAAEAYARVAPARGRIRRAVILGPCHRVPVRGLALPAAEAFETPLGTMQVDADAVRDISGMPQVVVSGAAHAQEHALEVQLPFLQRALGDVTIVPLVVGTATADEVADVLERLWGGPETLIVISSDLSHYHRYEDAQAIDAATVRSILALSPELDHEQACGATPIAGLLEVARRRGLSPQLFDLRNSGDTAGDKRRVVGYASLAFYEDGTTAEDYGDAHGRTLLRMARGSIREALGAGEAHAARDEWLDLHRATFVTLRQNGELRGCIGSLAPRRPLGLDVAANARAAALQDPRFAPLASHELAITEIEVSLLSVPVAVPFGDREDLFSRITPGVDGVVLSAGSRRATFLPQVWEDLPSHELFFAHLLHKAGLPHDFPLEHCEIERYTVRKWTENQLGLKP